MLLEFGKNRRVPSECNPKGRTSNRPGDFLRFENKISMLATAKSRHVNERSKLHDRTIDPNYKLRYKLKVLIRPRSKNLKDLRSVPYSEKDLRVEKTILCIAFFVCSSFLRNELVHLENKLDDNARRNCILQAHT